MTKPFSTFNGYEVKDAQARTFIEQAHLNIFEYKHLAVLPEGVTDYNEADWTEAIKQAIKDAAATGEGGKPPIIYFPWFGTGEYKTKPISFIGYNNIHLKGGGAEIHKNNEYLYGDENKPTNHVRIKFIASGDVGFKTASTVNPYVSGTEYCHGITIENIWLCGNNLVKACVNGNYDFTLKNVRASQALENCVVLEDYTFPCYIHNCNFGPSEGNGIFVRGAQTTVFTLDNVNCNYNQKYGFVFEGGAHASIIDCSAQSNPGGGLLIHKRNDLYNGTDFLHGLLFTNFYTEHNGLHEANSPNYDGNYAVRITKTGTAPTQYPSQARGISFKGGSINHTAGAKALGLDDVFGLTMECSVNPSTDVCDYGNCIGLYMGNRSTYVDNPPDIWRYTNAYPLPDGATGSIHMNHNIVKKGRYHTVPFFKNGVTGDGEGLLNVAGMTGSLIGSCYPINKGSVVGVKVFATDQFNNTNGTIKVSICKQACSTIASGIIYWKQNFVTLSKAEKYKEVYFDFFEHYFSDPTAFGIRISWSGIEQATDVAVYLIVED